MARRAATDADVLSLLDGRSGHFLLESGHHGELWLELDALLLRPALLTPFIEDLAERLTRGGRFDAICGPLLGGALIANAIAARLAREFYVAEPAPRGASGQLFTARYTVPAQQREHLAGKRVVVVDDVVNAGSATRATVADLREAGAVVVGVGALLVLGPHAAEYTRREGMFLARGAEVPNRIWEPRECPLCAAGQALEDPSDASPGEQITSRATSERLRGALRDSTDAGGQARPDRGGTDRGG